MRSVWRYRKRESQADGGVAANVSGNRDRRNDFIFQASKKRSPVDRIVRCVLEVDHG